MCGGAIISDFIPPIVLKKTLAITTPSPSDLRSSTCAMSSKLIFRISRTILTMSMPMCSPSLSLIPTLRFLMVTLIFDLISLFGEELEVTQFGLVEGEFLSLFCVKSSSLEGAGSRPSSPRSHCEGEGYNSDDEQGPCFGYDDGERERQFEIEIRQAKGLEVK